MLSYDTLEDLTTTDEYPFEEEEIYDLLRTKIAMLSQIYRDVIILYYYNGLPVKEIAKRLCLPEGTVTWRLSAGRSKLQKECATMKESALRPVKMNISITGTGNYNGASIPFPQVFIRDALSQNIFFHAYETPKTVEELSLLCGVPAYYLEDAVTRLRDRDALIEPSKGKYQTDFPIFSRKVGDYCVRAEEKLLPLIDPLLSALDGLADDAADLGHHMGGKPAHELWYLYGALAFSLLSGRYNPVSAAEREPKYDGNRFAYQGYLETDGIDRHTRLSTQHNANLGSRGSCTFTRFRFAGFSYQPMLFDWQINLCEDILDGRSPADKEEIARTIQAGALCKTEDGSLTVAVPAFSAAQKMAFGERAEKRLAPLMGEYTAFLIQFIEGYRALFPPHLAEEINHLCRDLFVEMFSAVARLAQRQGKICPPEPGSLCDVMIKR